MAKKKFYLGFRKRQMLGGILFTLPFVIGFVLFFLRPLAQAVQFSFHELVLTSVSYELAPRGWSNYLYAFQVHPEFTRLLTEVLQDLATTTPMIIAFSFFAANIINQDFKGRTLVRVLFFLPVIMGAGVIMKLEMNDYSRIMLQHAQEGARFGGAALRNIFENSSIPEGMMDYVVGAAESLPMVIRSSGVQILIFLAGLQSIPRDVYEAASVEGATAWERFWLITFPMLTPLILTNIIYTIIDSFTVMNNELVLLIRETMLRGAGYGVSMAMAMIYFVAIAIVLAIVFAVLSKRVYYHV
ncbi:MAG: sugar ABC transporter permease [Firmicutes bacterium]|mgnify:FL=1|nr:sugar ABC transporter permease [Bacillota bacterium]